MRKIAIIGVGNLLQTDDGVGIWVIEELRKKSLPSNVELWDAATDPLTALEAMDGKDKAIVVDAFQGGDEHPPGTIYRYRIEDLNFEDDENVIDISMHGVTFLDALKRSKHAYDLPREIVIYGIEPAKIEIGMELSEELEKRMPALINVILEEIK